MLDVLLFLFLFQIVSYLLFCTRKFQVKMAETVPLHLTLFHPCTAIPLSSRDLFPFFPIPSRVLLRFLHLPAPQASKRILAFGPGRAHREQEASVIALPCRASASGASRRPSESLTSLALHCFTLDPSSRGKDLGEGGKERKKLRGE